MVGRAIYSLHTIYLPIQMSFIVVSCLLSTVHAGVILDAPFMISLPTCGCGNPNTLGKDHATQTELGAFAVSGFLTIFWDSTQEARVISYLLSYPQTDLGLCCLPKAPPRKQWKHHSSSSGFHQPHTLFSSRLSVFSLLSLRNSFIVSEGYGGKKNKIWLFLSSQNVYLDHEYF